jgi:hypothetical protein
MVIEFNRLLDISNLIIDRKSQKDTYKHFIEPYRSERTLDDVGNRTARHNCRNEVEQDSKNDQIIQYKVVINEKNGTYCILSTVGI